MTIRIRECEIVYRTRSVAVASRKVTSSEDVYRLVPELPNRAQESLVVLLLDARQQVIGKHEAARGGLSSCTVDGASVFRGGGHLGRGSGHPRTQPPERRSAAELR